MLGDSKDEYAKNLRYGTYTIAITEYVKANNFRSAMKYVDKLDRLFPEQDITGFKRKTYNQIIDNLVEIVANEIETNIDNWQIVDLLTHLMGVTRTVEHPRLRDSKIVVFNALARYKIENREFQDALLWADAVLLLDPQNINALYYKALALDKLGNTHTAIATISMALSQKPTDHILLKVRAALYWKSKQYALAVKDSEHILSITFDEEATRIINDARSVEKSEFRNALLFYLSVPVAISGFIFTIPWQLIIIMVFALIVSIALYDVVYIRYTIWAGVYLFIIGWILLVPRLP